MCVSEHIYGLYLGVMNYRFVHDLRARSGERRRRAHAFAAHKRSLEYRFGRNYVTQLECVRCRQNGGRAKTKSLP